MKVCRMCWALLDEQLNRCNCTQGADPSIFFKDTSEMVNHFVSEYRKEIKHLKEKLKFYTEPFEMRPTYQVLEQKLEKIKDSLKDDVEADYYKVKKIKEILRLTKDGECKE